MPIQTCFESELELALFLRLNPTADTKALSFSDWLNQVQPLPPIPNRLEIATGFTRTHLSAKEWLPTIEWLRMALVLTPEQVTYCFSQLPTTKKNRALRECFLFYLNSPLRQDVMSQVWSLVEKLKSPGEDKPELSSLDFIPSEPSGYLFQELLKAAASLSPSVRVYPFSHFGLPAEPGPPLIHVGSKILALSEFCNAITSFSKTNPDQNILISFLGSSQSKAFLRNYLASNGLSCEDFSPIERPAETYWTRLLRALRTTSFLETDEKLKLNSVLLAHPPFNEELEENYRARLLDSKRVSAEHLETLLAFKSERSFQRVTENKKVLITPFTPLPQLTGYTEFSFVDDTFLERTPHLTLFSEGELETLFFAGFHLPRWSETLQSRLRVLKEKASTLSDRVYTSLPPDELLGFEIESIAKTRQAALKTQKTSYQAALPVQTLSATQLETYAECPSKYLYRRFKLHQVPMPLSEFSLHLGQAVHLTLETLFSTTQLPSLNEDTLRSAFYDSLLKTLPQLSKQENLILFFKKSFEKMIPRVLQLEHFLKEFFGERAIAAVEKEFKIEVDGLSIVGKMDRVDRLANQSLLVLDYKTGTVDFTPDHLAKGINFQALLYWLGAEHSLSTPPAAMLFYDLKKGEIRRGLAREELITPGAKKALTRGHAMASEKLDSLIEAGKKAMQTYAAQIRSGDFTPTANPEVCRFCEASGFCREGITHV